MQILQWIADFFLGKQSVPAPFPAEAIITHTKDGVAVDFTLPDDPRIEQSRRAWRAFEIGIFILLGAILWFAVCVNMEWPGTGFLCVPAFLLGLELLIVAANISSRWRNPDIDEACRQLAIVGAMLIRTARDQQELTWQRDEILALAVESETLPDSDFALVLYLEGGVTVVLTRSTDDVELERIARALRSALPAHAVEHAIQADKTRITK
jgi:hypothetical protein